MAINVQKLVPSSFSSQQVSQEKLIEVKRSVIDVEKLMTGILAFEKKQQDTQRQEREEKRYQKREEQLEKRQTKKQFKMNLPTLPKMGFFDWIKNFVTNTLLGFFAVRLLKYTPQLIGVAQLALNASDAIIGFAGGLLNGAATFIEWGYKAYDATRGFLRQIGGDNTAQLFDKFLGGLDLFLTLSLGASIITGFDSLKKSVGDTARRGLIQGAAASGTGAAGQRARTATFAKQRELAKAARAQKASQRSRRLSTAVPRRDFISNQRRVAANAIATREIGGVAAGGSGTAVGEKLLSEYSDVTSKADLLRRNNRILSRKPSPENLRKISANEKVISRLDFDADRITEKIKAIQKNQRKITKRAFGSGKYVPRDIPKVSTPEGPILTSKGFRQQINITPEELMFRAEQGQTDFSEFISKPKSKFGIEIPGAPKIAPKVSQISGTKLFLRQAKGILGRFKIPIIGGLIDFGLSVALGEDPGRAAFRAIGAGLLGGVLGAAGSVVPLVGNFIGGLVGGAAGDAIGGVLYDIIFGNKKPQTKEQKTEGYAGGGGVGRGPQKQVKRRREYLSQPGQKPVDPGKDVGRKKFEEMFPKGSSGGLFGIGSKKDAYGYIQSAYGELSGAGFFGPLFGIAIKALSGDKPSPNDYRASSIALSNWMSSTFGTIAAQGFANGGLVAQGAFLDSREIQKVIQSSLEERVTRDVDDAINELRRRLGIDPKGGKPGEQLGPGGAYAAILKEDEMTLLQQLVLAEASGEGKLGMALVARSVLNRAGLIQSGTVAPGMFLAQDKSIYGVVMGDGQYTPVSDGSLYTQRSTSEMKMALDAIKLAQNISQLKKELKSAGFSDADIEKLISSTGFRNYAAAGIDPSQQVNEVTFKRHTFNTAGNTKMQVMSGTKIKLETGAGYGSEGSGIVSELGKFIQSKLKSPEQYQAITEHPDFGGVVGQHAEDSYHYSNRAIDIGAYSYEQGPILEAIEEFNRMKGIKPVELLHAGNDSSGGHDDHVHVAYFSGGSTGKGGVIRVHEDEWVVDKDSKKLYGNAFLHLINSTENESQRKQNSLRLMSILQSYAGYESGFEQTVTVPVPSPQMIPVPIMMQESEPMILPSRGGGSSGRASDILESIG